LFFVNGRVVCNINGQILGTSECNGFGPAMKVDNMIILLTLTPIILLVLIWVWRKQYMFM